MRKFLLIGAAALSINLGACTTTQVTDFLKQVQAAAATACAFVPTIDTILAVTSALGLPTAAVGATIATVAGAICKQVPPPTSAAFRALPRSQQGFAATVGTVNGIPINGWRAR